MSADVANLQAQVEAVLGALVKAATVELTKLIQSSYGASAAPPAAGPAGSCGRNGAAEAAGPPPSAGSKRSVGVQVDEDVYSTVDFYGLSLSPDDDNVREHSEEEEEEEMKGRPVPPEILQPEDNGQVDPERSPLKQQVAAETVDVVELSGLEAESPADSEPHTEVVLQGTWTEKLNYASAQSPPTKQKPLVIQPDTCDIISGGNVKFVCPLILKPQSPPPKADASETPAGAEPRQACVSTAQGTAYSPSPTDGAATPAQGGVWEWVHTSKEESNFQLKLKLTSPDQKPMRPCEVRLVDILKASEQRRRGQEAKGPVAKQQSRCPLPKDLRRHQGLHTGHRFCCFAPCGDAVWRLREVVTHTRDGYVCSICGKAFKRRKILRRHERFHTGEKPYSCPACSKTFALRKSLRRHMRFHTGERPHTCTHCNKSFRLRDNLKAHLRFHTGEKPFSCTSCGKLFRIMRNKEKHHCEIFVPSFRMIAGL